MASWQEAMQAKLEENEQLEARVVPMALMKKVSARAIGTLDRLNDILALRPMMYRVREQVSTTAGCLQAVKSRMPCRI
jgi:hypothetical protein